MNSPRYRPAGLLVCWASHRVMLDGGGSADPGRPLDAWLVSDEHAELMPCVRRRAAELGVAPGRGCIQADAGVAAAGAVHLTSELRISDRDDPAAGRVGAGVLGVTPSGRPGPISCSPMRRGGTGRSGSPAASAATPVCATWRRRRTPRVCGDWSSLTSAGPASGRSTGASARPSGSGAAMAQSSGCADALSPSIVGPVGPVCRNCG